jgi:ABC-type Mn2+/Zn2+ transport system ATPase subunit
MDGHQPDVLIESRQITIIGTNGAGKSRFCSALVDELGDKAYRISALKAMFPSPASAKPLPGSIDDLFNRMNEANPQVKNIAETEFDKLFYVMLSDEVRELMNYKAHKLMGEQMEFPKTKLDITVKKWQEVFPKNKVLRENGKLMFTSVGYEDKYPLMGLSDGEKSVLYYIGAVLYAMPDAAILVDDPETFIHSSIMRTLWNVLEQMRPDCTFIYNTHDVSFASSRIDNQCVWVREFDPESMAWDYEVMTSSRDLDNALLDLLGSRKPVLFIEGDDKHSIDSRLYPLIFPEYTIKPLGSCNKVIETVRSFGDLQNFHQLESCGIVDRDRRSEQEVEYLRKKNILVPDVAEVENLFMLEGVIRAVALHKRRNPDIVFPKVKKRVVLMFTKELKQQALQHVRHRVKRDVEMRIDMKFTSINALENHMVELVSEINPRGLYDQLCREFHIYEDNNDYASILRVYNQKQMLNDSNVATLCGFKSKDDYIRGVLNILKGNSNYANDIRHAIKACFGLEEATENEQPATEYLT